MTLQGIKSRTASLLDVSNQKDKLSYTVDLFLIGLILVNVAAVILESVASIKLRWSATFYWLETLSLSLFTLEYLLRVWSITANQYRSEYHHPLWGRLKFIGSPMALIDLLAIAPFWLQLIFPMDLRFLRVVRLLRILKLTRYSAAMNFLFDVVREEGKVIGAALFSALILLLLTSSAIYLAENSAQPEVFSSIPQALWWGTVTLTTVGYGDMVPVTPLGKLLGAMLGFIGVGLVALPAGILASGFNNALHRRKNSLRREVGIALEDGVIDDQEQTALKSHAEALNLSNEDMAEILHESAGSHALTCPYCGQALDNQSGRHAA